MPYESSDIQHKMFYSVMTAEMLQIYKATSKFQNFLKSARILIKRIIKQGGLINHMKNGQLKPFHNHKKCIIKFVETNGNTLKKLLSIYKLIYNLNLCITLNSVNKRAGHIIFLKYS